MNLASLFFHPVAKGLWGGLASACLAGWPPHLAPNTLLASPASSAAHGLEVALLAAWEVALLAAWEVALLAAWACALGGVLGCCTWDDAVASLAGGRLLLAS